jgi:hypothetical protein
MWRAAAPIETAAQSFQVDWNARFADFSLTTGTDKNTTEKSWLKRFVSDQALKRDTVNPNANIRVSLPAIPEHGPKLRNPVGLL